MRRTMTQPLCLYCLLMMTLTIGCRSLATTPDRHLTQQFETIDRLVVVSSDSDVEHTDPETIDRLRDIYLRADWKPFLDTTPGDTVAIRAFVAEQEAFRLLYGAGWLMEWTYDTGPIRKGILNEADREWLSSLSRQSK